MIICPPSSARCGRSLNSFRNVRGLSWVTRSNPSPWLSVLLKRPKLKISFGKNSLVLLYNAHTRGKTLYSMVIKSYIATTCNTFTTKLKFWLNIFPWFIFNFIEKVKLFKKNSFYRFFIIFQILKILKLFRSFSEKSVRIRSSQTNKLLRSMRVTQANRNK